LKNKGNTIWKHTFIDYDKAFDSTQTQILLGIWKSQNIRNTLLKAIVDIHPQNKILTQFKSKLSRGAENNIGVFQVWHILLYEIITKWQKEDSKGIALPKKKKKSMSVNAVICGRPSDNIYRRRQIAETCVQIKSNNNKTRFNYICI
jgi:hypothetical protein